MAKKSNVELVSNEPVVVAPPVEQPLNVNVVERLADADKAVLDNSKVRRELANANLKAAAAQNEAAEVGYQNVILQLAMKYHLVDGDTISEAGEIQRRS